MIYNSVFFILQLLRQVLDYRALYKLQKPFEWRLLEDLVVVATMNTSFKPPATGFHTPISKRLKVCYKLVLQHILNSFEVSMGWCMRELYSCWTSLGGCQMVGCVLPPPHAPHGRSTPDSLLLLLLNTISTLDPYI